MHDQVLPCHLCHHHFWQQIKGYILTNCIYHFNTTYYLTSLAESGYISGQFCLIMANQIYLKKIRHFSGHCLCYKKSFKSKDIIPVIRGSFCCHTAKHTAGYTICVLENHSTKAQSDTIGAFCSVCLFFVFAYLCIMAKRKADIM